MKKHLQIPARGRGRSFSMWRPRQLLFSFLAAALLLWGFSQISIDEIVDTMPYPPLPLDDTHEPVPEAHITPHKDPELETESRCPEYGFYASVPHAPFTHGIYELPYQRPAPECRKVVLPEVEEVIRDMKKAIKDPDLSRLFENCFPNTLDTSVLWSGISSTNREEELTFITTGDIPAMWLRDSANQLQSYVSLLTPSPNNHKRNTLASLFRGAINLQSRYITASPHCNAFQPPLESVLAPGNDGNRNDFVLPPYDPSVVFECKYELDSLGAFLQLSWDYFNRTGDAAFFRARSGSRSGDDDNDEDYQEQGQSGWKGAVIRILATMQELQAGTYSPDGMVPPSPYRFTRFTPVATETLANGGNGSPVRAGTGLVRSAFRPSDDACTFQFLVPANMMLARYLELCAGIMDGVDEDEDEDGESSVAGRMRRMAAQVRKGIEKHGRVQHPDLGEIYAYEVDGYWSSNMMDDANLPSLLSAPLMGYVDRKDPVYQTTRKFILSTENPYYDHGPVMNGTGGAHIGPGMVWPMSLIVAIMTSDDDKEIIAMLGQLVSSTDGLGLIHESVNVYNQEMWTRAWFSWANGLFGQMMLDLKERKPHILKTSFQ